MRFSAKKDKCQGLRREAASVLSHTEHIGAPIKDVLSLASFEVGALTSWPTCLLPYNLKATHRENIFI